MERPINDRRKNFSRAERTALDQLARNKSITIKPCDKGGGITIFDTTKYNKKILDLLADAKYYKRLLLNPTSNHMQELKVIIQRAEENKWITEKESKFLINKYPKVAYVYGLGKIHKNKIDPPLRIIVSGNESLTENISKFMDFQMQPLVQNIPSLYKRHF